MLEPCIGRGTARPRRWKCASSASTEAGGAAAGCQNPSVNLHVEVSGHTHDYWYFEWEWGGGADLRTDCWGAGQVLLGRSPPRPSAQCCGAT